MECFVMRNLRSRGDRIRRSMLRACIEPLEGRRLLSLSASADAAQAAMNNLAGASAGAVPLATQPMITGSRPANGEVVPRYTSIALDVQLAVSGSGIDPNTLNTNNVKLNRTSDGQFVNANVNIDAGGAAIV